MITGRRAWRLTRATMYLGTAAAGVLALFIPSLQLLSGMLGVTVIAWTSLLIIGGGLCFAAHAVRIRELERMGLPALITAYTVYGFTAILSHGSTGRIVFGMLLLTFALGLTARLLDVTEDIRFARANDARSAEEGVSGD
jgi:hypothetical protein